jgi:hypothetical protein
LVAEHDDEIGHAAEHLADVALDLRRRFELRCSKRRRSEQHVLLPDLRARVRPLPVAEAEPEREHADAGLVKLHEVARLLRRGDVAP